MAREFITLSNRSRYKDTPVFLSGDEDPQPEFGLFVTPVEFTEDRLSDQVHRVKEDEIGFLDKIAVVYYGPGFEDLWWIIATANSIIDPDQEMFVGQVLRIPPRDLIIQFNSRAGEAQK